jgi:hypothetical protein
MAGYISKKRQSERIFASPATCSDKDRVFAWLVKARGRYDGSQADFIQNRNQSAGSPYMKNRTCLELSFLEDSHAHFVISVI